MKNLIVIASLLFTQVSSASAFAADNDWRSLTSSGLDAMKAGKSDEALATLEKALIEAERIHFEDDAVAEAYSNLGRYYKRKADYAAAENYYRKALAKRRQTLSPYSPAIVRTLDDLFNIVWDQENAVALKAVAKQLQEALDKQTPPDYDHMERPLAAFAVIARDQRDYATALENLNRILTLRNTAYGANSEKVADAYSQIGHLYKDQHQYDKAREQFEKALTIRRSFHGATNLPVANTLKQIAWCYADQRQFSKAVPLFKEAVAVEREVYGPSSTKFVRTMRELSRCQESSGDTTAAAATIAELIAILRSTTSGANSLDLADALDASAGLNQRQKNYDAAIVNASEALAIREKLLTEQNTEVVRALQKLVDLQNDKKNYAEAQTLLRRQETILKALLGPEHPDYVWVQEQIKTNESRK